MGDCLVSITGFARMTRFFKFFPGVGGNIAVQLTRRNNAPRSGCRSRGLFFQAQCQNRMNAAEDLDILRQDVEPLRVRVNLYLVVTGGQIRKLELPLAVSKNGYSHLVT